MNITIFNCLMSSGRFEDYLLINLLLSWMEKVLDKEVLVYVWKFHYG